MGSLDTKGNVCLPFNSDIDKVTIRLLNPDSSQEALDEGVMGVLVLLAGTRYRDPQQPFSLIYCLL
jgi:hypothetical protein